MNEQWTRRRFVAAAAAAGLAARAPAAIAEGIQASAKSAAASQPAGPQSQAASPEILSGHLAPLLESNVARSLRYRPIAGGFEIVDGSEFFNRPLYGPNIPFRADGGDLPEFSLYLPGHGGNLRLGVAHDGVTKWLHDCERVRMQYVGGRLEYELHDPLLGEGALQVEVLAQGAALWLRIVASSLHEGTSLLFAFGGVSGKKGKRNGDIGCEDEPVSQFFHMRPDECAGNRWTLGERDSLTAEVVAAKARLRVHCSSAAQLHLGDAGQWDGGAAALWATAAASQHLPVLLGSLPLASEPVFVSVTVLEGAVLPSGVRAEVGDAVFRARREELDQLAGTIVSRTPDAFLDSSVAAMNIAADAIWDEAQGCVMHGAVAWRMPLAGWRGPYSLDVLDRHDRMRRHLRRWIARQNVTAVTNGSGGEATSSGFRGIVNATGQPDAGSHLARAENLLHSNGDLSHNHYDMNLVFFDALLRHLRWTGDIEFAHEAWPALERHAAWERRLFRREYGSAGATAPLYEAYAAIWASDNLQYNGGGAAHSSAYNVYLNRGMAELAALLGQPAEVIAAYRSEAESIAQAMREHLWMSECGAFAESRDWLGDRAPAESPAVWTMYQALDSEVPDVLEAWQLAADQLRRQRKVPVCGEGVPEDAGWLLPCSDWMPYVWSLTLLVMAEELGTALALFQAGMADEGYALLRGTLMDAGFRGLCPGNFPMSLQLDPHRQESQRDFGDPIGCMTRVLVEGLWGVRPELMQGRISLRPLLPLAWEHAELAHPELHLVFDREGQRDTWSIESKFAMPIALTLELRARSIKLPEVTVNGRAVACVFAPDAVGEPRLLLRSLPAASLWKIEIAWSGAKPLERAAEPLHAVEGQRIMWPEGVQRAQMKDPQRALHRGIASRAGAATVFLLQQDGDCCYWLPVNLAVQPRPVSLRRLTIAGEARRVPLQAVFNGHVHEILTRDYSKPRPGLCSLQLPAGLLGGWADFDVKAEIDDAGVRRSDGQLDTHVVHFDVPKSQNLQNCCFLSHFSQDEPSATVALEGRGAMLYLLLAGTTFPQATRTCHAEAVVRYAMGPEEQMELASPESWWPVEQDYLVDDFLFRTNPTAAARVSVPVRVDLGTGLVRDTVELTKPGARGGKVAGGSAFVVAIHLDSSRTLRDITLRVRLYGVVLAWMGLTIGAP